MKTFWTLLEIFVKIFKGAQKEAEERQIKKKVDADAETIKDAFNENDEEKLNDLFNSR